GANYEVQAAGAPRLSTGAAVAIPSTASTGWSVLEIEAGQEACWFHGRAIDSTAARTHSYVRHQQISDPDALYRWRLRVRNRQIMAGISAVADNGAGAIRLTRSSHGLTTGEVVTVENVAGVPGANGVFAVTVIDTANIDLIGTSFAGAYVNTGWATLSRNAGPATSTVVKL
ncbi:hypothetical protein NON00_24705, partial [Roseomonas sp. GC11]|nr:hypothetical protein [Roseomonas sp. GC11]